MALDCVYLKLKGLFWKLVVLRSQKINFSLLSGNLLMCSKLMALKEGSRGCLMLRREAVRWNPANNSSQEMFPIKFQKSSSYCFF